MQDEDHSGTISWFALLAEAVDALQANGIVDAEIDARRIAEEASGIEAAMFLFEARQPATKLGVARFERMLARRCTGEPLQYVLGHWGFRQLDLFLDRRVLIPRPETEQVVEVALAEIDRVRKDLPGLPLIADLGTGSGAIALSVASERTGVEVWATDQSLVALAVARANLVGIGRAATRVRIAHGWWFDALPHERRGEFSVLIANPPYVAETDELPRVVALWEPVEALVPGPTGYEALDHLVVAGYEWLAPGGAIVLELAPSQAAGIADLARNRGYSDVEIHEDLAGRERTLLARKPLESGATTPTGTY